jgi:hypothetical protein
MPLHCDNRPFSDEDNIHAHIEEEWDDIIKKCYSIDFDNERFFYDPQGYPIKKDGDPVADWLEQEIIDREFSITWGANNGNTWDFMASIVQYSYLMAYKMIPANYTPQNLDWNTFLNLNTGFSFEEYSKMLLIDSIDSIAKIWLRVWIKYRKWVN